jgi:hypothetical protein
MDAKQDICMDNHPLLRPFGIVLDTPAIDALHELATRWLWTGASGAYVLGDSRMGKTTALETLGATLCLRDSRPVPVHMVTVHKRDRPTINSLYRRLNHSAEVHLKSRDVTDDMFSNFLTYLLDLVSAYQVDRVVLLVDEMQRLSVDQFHVFAELYDELKTLKVALMTVFMGNREECQDIVELFRTKTYRQIRGRFFTLHGTFHGLRSRQEVQKCLAQYDERRYPEHSGPTYTEYFLPEAYAKGWRLASLDTLLWSSFREYQQIYNLDSWGMQYFVASVNTLLVDFLPRMGIDALDEALVNTSLALSGLDMGAGEV